MKLNLALATVLTLIPTFLYAQYDSKYLAGAVPEVNGKVVFTKTIEFPDRTQQQAYDIVLAVAEQFCKTSKDSRLVYSDAQAGDVAIAVKEFLVFQDRALSVDKALMTCSVVLHCQAQKITATMSNIRYQYYVADEVEPIKYTAENIITDKKALSNNKLTKSTAKFRNATIDFANNIFSQIYKQSAAGGSSSNYIATAIVASPTVVQSDFVKMELDKIPQTILKMLPESEMAVTPQSNSKQSEAKAQWKGFGYMAGKNTTSISIDPESKVYKSIGNNEDYSILFSKDSGVWFIIKCRKQGESFDGKQKVIIGEILSIEVK